MSFSAQWSKSTELSLARLHHELLRSCWVRHGLGRGVGKSKRVSALKKHNNNSCLTPHISLPAGDVRGEGLGLPQQAVVLHS